ncbi:hypothetical protein [Flavobacterium sp.]|uniref:hypothetical protein n=1 Tax=Flavobacterium sp. TaxID=239 RepID=UPI0011F7EA45|nr:hypothetical protein [Flavobacterium sp.]RZJ73058.1 MAG: hypothetical protein EOO49_05345 [Flavobacterium sp.]
MTNTNLELDGIQTAFENILHGSKNSYESHEALHRTFSNFTGQNLLVLQSYVTLPKTYHFTKSSFLTKSLSPMAFTSDQIIYSIWFVPAKDSKEALQILNDLRLHPEYEFHF